ncbi:hypothetical protein DFH09DRAFT_1413679 [Mycena vulgaris]|nr:hypothetical protein DFH09DRAFT_1413679 [Mycena vulgaris]
MGLAFDGSKASDTKRVVSPLTATGGQPFLFNMGSADASFTFNELDEQYAQVSDEPQIPLFPGDNGRWSILVDAINVNGNDIPLVSSVECLERESRRRPGHWVTDRFVSLEHPLRSLLTHSQRIRRSSGRKNDLHSSLQQLCNSHGGDWASTSSHFKRGLYSQYEMGNISGFPYTMHPLI